MPKPRLMFENDSRHTLLYMCEPPVAQEGCEAAVDELLGTPIEALVFNLGFGNAFSSAPIAMPTHADQRRFAALGSGGTGSRGDFADTADARH